MSCSSTHPQALAYSALTYSHGVQVDQVGNLAAFARIDDSGEIKFTTFEAQPVRLLALLEQLGRARLTVFPVQHPSHIRPMMYAGSMGMGMM